MQLIHSCDANKKSLQRYFFSGEKQEGVGERKKYKNPLEFFR